MRNSFRTPLIVEVMESGNTFKLAYGFTYHWYDKKANPRQYLHITVKAGFVTDFASIPRGARLIIPKLGRYTKASVIHDYLYQKEMVPVAENILYAFNRKQADRCFLEGMLDLGVAPWKARLMYLSVRAFGWVAWKK